MSQFVNCNYELTINQLSISFIKIDDTRMELLIENI